MNKYFVDIYYTNFGQNKFFRSTFNSLEECLTLTNSYIWTMKKNGKFTISQISIGQIQQDKFTKRLINITYDLF